MTESYFSFENSRVSPLREVTAQPSSVSLRSALAILRFFFVAMRHYQMSSNLTYRYIGSMFRTKTVIGRIYSVTATLDGAIALCKSNTILNFNINE